MDVRAHYGTESLRDRVAAALDQAGLGDGPLDWADLAPLDQFHVRGLAATRELAAALDPQAGEGVLDVGSGLGGPARLLAALRGCRVTGVDLSLPFVDAAALLARRTGLAGRVAYVQADALRLPFADGAFDHAWTQHVAMNIADRAGLYRELHRVVRTGGRLALYDVVAGEGGAPLFPVPWAATPAASFLLTPDAMRAALDAAGFAVLSWQDKSDEAIDWFARQAAAGRGRSPLGIHVAMGEDFPGMTANMARSLRERRVRLLQAVVRRVG